MKERNTQPPSLADQITPAGWRAILFILTLLIGGIHLWNQSKQVNSAAQPRENPAPLEQPNTRVLGVLGGSNSKNILPTGVFVPLSKNLKVLDGSNSKNLLPSGGKPGAEPTLPFKTASIHQSCAQLLEEHAQLEAKMDRLMELFNRQLKGVDGLIQQEKEAYGTGSMSNGGYAQGMAEVGLLNGPGRTLQQHAELLKRYNQLDQELKNLECVR